MKFFAHWLTLAIFSCMALAGCTSTAADAPPLAATNDPAPAQSGNWLQDTGDAAWNAVASPINGLVPKPRPRPAAVELTPIDPPEMVIITRESRGVVTTEPAATQP